MSTMEKTANNQVTLTITVPAADFDAAMQRGYLKRRGAITIPGFRKGKAPRAMIEQFYGEGIFFEEAFEELAGPAIDAAIKEHELDVVSRPDVDVEQIGKGQDLIFKAVVYTKPEVKLGEYKGIETAEPAYNVTDEEVEAEVLRNAERRARMVEITDRAAQDGDITTIDYCGKVDGVAFAGGTAEKQELTLGSGMFIPGFEEQVVGMNIGEEKDINVTFPTEYHSDELAGKAAVFTVKLHAIKEKEIPALDDEFAKDVSEFDTLDEYKADVRAKLEATKKQQAETQWENELVEKLANVSEVEIPEPMVDRELDYMIQDMEMRMRYQGLNMEDYLKYTGMTMDMLREQSREDARMRVKTQLVIEALQKAENVEVTEEELADEIKDFALRIKKDPEEYAKTVSENEKSYMKDRRMIVKTLQILKDNCKFVEAAEEPKAEDAEA